MLLLKVAKYIQIRTRAQVFLSSFLVLRTLIVIILSKFLNLLLQKILPLRRIRNIASSFCCFSIHSFLMLRQIPIHFILQVLRRLPLMNLLRELNSFGQTILNIKGEARYDWWNIVPFISFVFKWSIDKGIFDLLILPGAY